MYEPMERIMIEKHLGRLFKRGDVRRVDDRFSIV
jgi:hypothetical protein